MKHIRTLLSFLHCIGPARQHNAAVVDGDSGAFAAVDNANFDQRHACKFARLVVSISMT